MKRQEILGSPAEATSLLVDNKSELFARNLACINTPGQLKQFLYEFADENKSSVIHNRLTDQHGCGNAILFLSNEFFIVDFPVGNINPRLIKFNTAEKPVSKFRAGKCCFFSNNNSSDSSVNPWPISDKNVQILIFFRLSIKDLENWLYASVNATDQLLEMLQRLHSPEVVLLQDEIAQIGYKRFFGYGAEPSNYDLSSLKTLVNKSIINYILFGVPLPLDGIQLVAKKALGQFSSDLPVGNPSIWFYNACRYGNIDQVWLEHLMQNYQIDLDIQVEDGRGDGGYGHNKITVLHTIAKNKDVSSLKLLIKYGANIDALSTVTKECPLAIAIQAGNSPAVLALLEAGASVTANINTEKPQPLFEAVEKGDINIVKLIVAKNNDFDVLGGFDGSVLATAVHFNRVEILKYLLQYNVDTERRWLRQFPGKRALSLAVKKGNMEMIDALIEKGANVYFHEAFDNNVLIVAWENNRKDIIDRIMLHHKKDIRKLYPFIRHQTELLEYVENLLQSNNVALPRNYPPVRSFYLW